MGFLAAFLPTWVLAGLPGREGSARVKDGRPTISVTYASKHSAVQEAAQDLAPYVEKMSGAQLQVSQGIEDQPSLDISLVF